MRPTTWTVTELAEAVAGAMPVMDESEQHVALALYRLLAEGRPVGTAQVAEATGLAEEQVSASLDRWPGVFRDDDNRVVGFWGLAVDELTPTHRVENEAVVLYAWCAWDTLFLPARLATTLRVTSIDPISAKSIALEVSPERIAYLSHPDTMMSFRVPGEPFDSGVVESFCHFVHFFTGPDTGDRWVATHPDTFLLRIDEAFELASVVNRRKYPALGAM
jgi:alkylmercury lyase